MNTSASPRRPSAAGFTLIELLTVLVLLGIGVSLAAPRVDRMAMGHQTEGAIGRLSADIAYARVLAVRWGRPTSVRFSATGTEYSVTVDTAGTASPNFRVVKTVQVAQEYPGVLLTFPSSQVSFDTRGIVSAGVGSFTAARGGVADTLQLSITGRTYRAN